MCSRDFTSGTLQFMCRKRKHVQKPSHLVKKTSKNCIKAKQKQVVDEQNWHKTPCAFDHTETKLQNFQLCTKVVNNKVNKTE